MKINLSGTVWQSVSYVLMKGTNHSMGAFQCIVGKGHVLQGFAL